MTVALLLIIIAMLGWAIALIHEVGQALNKVDLATAKDARAILEAIDQLPRQISTQAISRDGPGAVTD